MLKKTLMGICLAGVMTLGAIGQEVVVRVRPPHPVVEARVVAPGPGYIWIAGYHRWDGHAYVWVPDDGDATPPACSLGSASLGPSERRLGFGRRTLALERSVTNVRLSIKHHQGRSL